MNAPDENITCPLCSSPAWPSAIRLGAYAAECGTAWGTFLEPRQTPSCATIASLRFQIDLLELGQVAS